LPNMHANSPSAGSAHPMKTTTTETIRVSQPVHLCRLQAATREFCRTVGLGEPHVFDAVIAVTELAHDRFIARGRRGRVELSAVRGPGGITLEFEARDDGAADDAPTRVRLTPNGGRAAS